MNAEWIITPLKYILEQKGWRESLWGHQVLIWWDICRILKGKTGNILYCLTINRSHGNKKVFVSILEMGYKCMLNFLKQLGNVLFCKLFKQAKGTCFGALFQLWFKTFCAQVQMFSSRRMYARLTQMKSWVVVVVIMREQFLIAFG